MFFQNECGNPCLNVVDPQLQPPGSGATTWPHWTDFSQSGTSPAVMMCFDLKLFLGTLQVKLSKKSSSVTTQRRGIYRTYTCDC